jgi:excisionase family DNA binding protein
VIEQHYTAREIADQLKVSESAILRACRDGKLRSFVVPGGRSRRIPESAVEEWLNAGAEGSRLAPVTELRKTG